MPGSPETKRHSVTKRAWLAVAVAGAIGVFFGALMMFGWMIDETHFDRQDEGFDRLAAQVENTPGVSVDSRERWVEAPTFSGARSCIHLSVDEPHLVGLLTTACASAYADPVDWSLSVHTRTGSVVSLYTDAASEAPSVESPCPDFGFDAPGVVAEVGRSLPGLDVQASIWDNGRFALVVLDDAPGRLSAMLPLVDRADDVRVAAGLDRRRPVEINAGPLSVVIPPDEHDGYLALLSELADEHGVVSFWAGGGTPVDGVEKVQIAAPEAEHAAIEDAVRASGLHIADLVVRFIEVTP
jgi:hypothetical protein